MMRLVRQPFTVLFAVIFGLLIAPLVTIGMHGLASIYDDAFPVVSMHGELVYADKDEVLIRISGVKHRSCQYLRVQAMVRSANGDMSDAYIQRADIRENGDSKPPGNYYLGEWRIWPRSNAVEVVVNANHLCGDRLVITQIAKVPL